MLKKIAIIALSMLPFVAMAQEPKFGHINAQEIVLLMPQLKDAQAQLKTLSEQYEGELVKMNEDGQNKLREFNSLAKDTDPGIVQTKRTELEALGQRIELAKQTFEEQIQKKQESLYAPILEQVNNAIQEVGKEHGFFYIFNQAVPSILYYSPKSEDVAPLVRKKLNIPADAKPAMM
ncbi:MAG: OmpH family outer membrane protein [Prevotellaceae bacterium]|jgi:outer membrane protein|nr:OmpH family outer membrane protein [Prevotellaceae bacterium]